MKSLHAKPSNYIDSYAWIFFFLRKSYAWIYMDTFHNKNLTKLTLVDERVLLFVILSASLTNSKT